MIVFEADGVIGSSLVNTGAFQEEKVKEVVDFLISKYFFSPKVLIDIGANIGTHLVYGLKSGIFSRAIGVEADPKNFRLLLCNAILNGLASKSELHCVALSNKTGFLELELSEGNFGDHRIRIDNYSSNFSFGEDLRKVVKVEAITLDGLMKTCNENLKNMLIWMDTQGHEGHIFNGAKRTFSGKDKPYIVTEFWPYGLERSGGKDYYFDMLSRCKLIFDINKENWQNSSNVNISTLLDQYVHMLSNTTELNHPHTDLLLIL